MPRYRKKPLEIEAIQIRADHWKNPSAWPVWLHEATQRCLDLPGSVWMGMDGATGLATVEIFTPNGICTGRVGSWIIQGVDGGLYPCEADIFEATYDPVGEGA